MTIHERYYASMFSARNQIMELSPLAGDPISLLRRWHCSIFYLKDLGAI